MNKTEFAKLMGIEENEISEGVYKEIERLYMESGKFKIEFCAMATAENLLFKLAKAESVTVKAYIDNLEAHHKSSTGTNMSVADYEQLKKSSASDKSATLSDAEAALLVSREFGFEASRIEILHEAEINVTEPGSIYLKIKKVAREPLNESTDWNYIRFNVHAAPAVWYYEMVNGSLSQVNI
jgi:hypothetical protein